MKPAQQFIYKTINNTGLPINIYLPSKENTSLITNDYFFVMIHGGAWQAIHPSDSAWQGSFLDFQAAYYADSGFYAASISYRSIDFSTDTTIKDLIADCRDALLFLKNRFGSRRFILLGDSAGAHLALSLALENIQDIYIVIAANPVTDLTLKRWHFTAPDNHTRYCFSPLYQVHPVSTKILCLHGDADKTVDYHLTESFCEKMTKTGNICDFFLIHDAPHAFLLMGYRSTPQQIQSYMSLIDKWLMNHICLS